MKTAKISQKTFFISVCIFLLIASIAYAAYSFVPVTRGIPETPDGIFPSSGDRENSYAWCMEELGGYLYVGSNRDLGYIVLMKSGLTSVDLFNSMDIPVPEERDFCARIFRFKLDGSESWQEVYRSPKTFVPEQYRSNAILPFVDDEGCIPADLGYRGIVSFKPEGSAVPYLYVSTIGLNQARVLRIDSNNPAAPQEVFKITGATSSLRAMAVHEGALFLGVLKQGEDLQILRSTNPEGNASWEIVATKTDFPDARLDQQSVDYGGVWDMVSFHGALYAFIGSSYKGSPDDGFLVYKGTEDSMGHWTWKAIVGDPEDGAIYPRGLGNRLNVTASPFVFNDHVYVGTFTDVIASAKLLFSDLKNENPEAINNFLTRLNPAQIYRFDQDDHWELVIGDPEKQLFPEGWHDQSGKVFTQRLGNYGAGFFNPGINQVLAGIDGNFSMNQYVWRMEAHEGKLFATTFDLRTFAKYAEIFAPEESKEDLRKKLDQLAKVNDNPPGFDLYVSEDGVNWEPLMRNGFGDPTNYGGRTLKSTASGLFVGTANPFWGAQVWKVTETGQENAGSAAGGGGGCNSIGLMPFAFLLLIPFFCFRKK